MCLRVPSSVLCGSAFARPSRCSELSSLLQKKILNANGMGGRFVQAEKHHNTKAGDLNETELAKDDDAVYGRPTVTSEWEERTWEKSHKTKPAYGPQTNVNGSETAANGSKADLNISRTDANGTQGVVSGWDTLAEGAYFLASDTVLEIYGRMTQANSTHINETRLYGAFLSANNDVFFGCTLCR